MILAAIPATASQATRASADTRDLTAEATRVMQVTAVAVIQAADASGEDVDDVVGIHKPV